MPITMETVTEITYRGEKITIKRRWVNGQPTDWGYSTSCGISGIGQADSNAAKEDAERAIDQKKRGDALCDQG